MSLEPALGNAAHSGIDTYESEVLRRVLDAVVLRYFDRARFWSIDLSPYWIAPAPYVRRHR